MNNYRLMGALLVTVGFALLKGEETAKSVKNPELDPMVDAKSQDRAGSRDPKEKND